MDYVVTEKRYTHIDIIVYLLRYGKKIHENSKRRGVIAKRKKDLSLERKKYDRRKDLIYHMNLLNEI